MVDESVGAHEAVGRCGAGGGVFQEQGVGEVGAFSSLLRGSGNNLVGHAELFPAGRFVAGIVGATAVTTVAATAAMKAKSRFDDRKAKLGTEEVAEEMPQITTAAAVIEASDVSVTRPIPV